MNFINNSSENVLISYWVLEMEGLGTYVTNTIKPGEKITCKSLTDEWRITNTKYENIAEFYNKPTSYKQIYYDIWDDNFEGEYVYANIHNNYISGYNSPEEQMYNTFILRNK